MSTWVVGVQSLVQFDTFVWLFVGGFVKIVGFEACLDLTCLPSLLVPWKNVVLEMVC